METQESTYILLILFAIMLGVFIFSIIVQRKTFSYAKHLWQLELEQQETNQKHEKAILESIIATADEEKERFAANLHDSLGGDLAVLLLQISSSKTIEKEERKELSSTVKDLINRVRLISHDATPPTLKHFGLKITLEKLCKQFNYQKQFDVHYEWIGESDRFSSKIELNVYCIAKELLNNAFKHAQAKNVWVRIKNKQHEFYLGIKDDGIGWNEHQIALGNGLNNMQMRAQLIGGNLEFSPKEGIGLTTRLFLSK